MVNNIFNEETLTNVVKALKPKFMLRSESDKFTKGYSVTLATSIPGATLVGDGIYAPGSTVYISIENINNTYPKFIGWEVVATEGGVVETPEPIRIIPTIEYEYAIMEDENAIFDTATSRSFKFTMPNFAITLTASVVDLLNISSEGVVSASAYLKNNKFLLSTINIPAQINGISALSIGMNAFFRFSNLKSLVIAPGITNIGLNAFDGCYNLERVILYGNTLTDIGDRAFGSCMSLKTISIPSSVKNIGGDAFSDCISLNCITINQGSAAVNIKDYAFYGCHSLVSLSIPDTVTSIGDSAFSYSMITSLKIPNGITSIKRSFIDCCALTTVFIPSSVSSIASNAFVGCDSLIEINIDNIADSIADAPWGAPNAKINWLQGPAAQFAVTADGTLSVTEYYKNNQTLFDSDVIIPDTVDGITVTKLAQNLFWWDGYITSVVVPDTVTEIGVKAFGKCYNLKSVIIRGIVPMVPYQFCFGSSLLSYVDIGTGATTISNAAFWECTSLRSIDFPNTLESVYFDAFTGCSNIIINIHRPADSITTTGRPSVYPYPTWSATNATVNYLG